MTSSLRERTTLMVLSADAMRQNLWPAFANWFAAEGISIVALVPARIEPQTSVRLYSRNHLAASQPDRLANRWLSAGMFGLDMSIVLIVRAGQHSQGSLQERLVQRKGASAPELRDANSLRGISPVADRCFSLVHTSDSLDQALVDAAIFFGKRRTFELWEGEEERPVQWSDIALLRGWTPLDREPHAWDLWLRVVLRVLTLLAKDARFAVDAAALAARDRLVAVREPLLALTGVEACNAVRHVLSDLAPLVQNVSRPRALSLPEPPYLPDLMALLSARSELFALLTWLCCPELLEAHQGPVLCDVLERNALSLEPSERHRMLGRVAWFGHPERA